jgi:hypothetical protein
MGNPMKRKDFERHIFWNLVKLVFKYPDARQLMRWISEGKLDVKTVGDLILEGRVNKRVSLPDWL